MVLIASGPWLGGPAGRRRGDRAAARRRLACAAVALAVHAAVLWQPPAATTQPALDVPVVIELSQDRRAVASPAETAPEQPAPAPEPPVAASPEPPAVAAPEPSPIAAAKPAPLRLPRATPRRPPARAVRQPPAPAEQTPQAEPSHASTDPPAPPAAAAADPTALPAWQGRLVAQLQHAKHYPDSSRLAGNEGVAVVSFTMDRAGHVLAVRLVRSAGDPALDEEATALVHRAEPLPPPPAEMPGATITLSVPIRFSLR